MTKSRGRRRTRVSWLVKIAVPDCGTSASCRKIICTAALRVEQSAPLALHSSSGRSRPSLAAGTAANQLSNPSQQVANKAGAQLLPIKEERHQPARQQRSALAERSPGVQLFRSQPPFSLQDPQQTSCPNPARRLQTQQGSYCPSRKSASQPASWLRQRRKVLDTVTSLAWTAPSAPRRWAQSGARWFSHFNAPKTVPSSPSGRNRRGIPTLRMRSQVKAVD